MTKLYAQENPLYSLGYQSLPSLLPIIQNCPSVNDSPSAHVSYQNAAFRIATLSFNRVLTKLVLAPLNRVEVNSFLDKLPERAKLPEEANTVAHRLEDVVDFTLCGETANAETNTAVGALITAAKGPENVAGFKRGRSTGTTRRKGDILERHQEGLTLDVGKGDVDATGVMASGVTVESSVLQRQETVPQLPGKRRDALAVVLLRVSN